MLSESWQLGDLEFSAICIVLPINAGNLEGQQCEENLGASTHDAGDLEGQQCEDNLGASTHDVLEDLCDVADQSQGDIILIENVTQGDKQVDIITILD